ncbi:MAG: hypothetical protein LIP00_11285 [Parabacteroides sp.]|nr:hypothetical protein [Parabacteroides sp.]
MKKILTIMLFAFACNLAFAQTDDNRKAAFHLSFVSPLGTNGLRSAQTTNTTSLNLLVGLSKNEEAFTLGGLSNVILNNAKGVQIGGLSNYVGNEGRGLQVAGLGNINKGSFNGFQFGGIFNFADEVKGVQFSGLVNIAEDVKGVQFAGLVNIAENSDVPIGLINIIKNGEMGIAVTYDGIGNAVASFRSGGKYTYGILGVGYNHKMKPGGLKNSLVAEAGLGAHIPVIKWFRINNELKVSTIDCNSSDPVLNAGYSLLPAFRVGRHFELFGGASINYMETKNVSAGNLFPKHSLWKGGNATKLQQVYIGYQVGVQFIF